MATTAKPQNITPDQKSFGARILMLPLMLVRRSNRQPLLASMARIACLLASVSVCAGLPQDTLSRSSPRGAPRDARVAGTPLRDPVLALDSRHQRVYARLRRAMRGNERSFAAAFGLAKTRYSAIWIGPAPSSTLRPSRGVARNDAGEKASSIHRKAWGVDPRAATASR